MSIWKLFLQKTDSASDFLIGLQCPHRPVGDAWFSDPMLPSELPRLVSQSVTRTTHLAPCRETPLEQIWDSIDAPLQAPCREQLLCAGNSNIGAAILEQFGTGTAVMLT